MLELKSNYEPVNFPIGSLWNSRLLDCIKGPFFYQNEQFIQDYLLDSAETKYLKSRGRIHPTTRVSQALRIAVNQKLEVLPCSINPPSGLILADYWLLVFIIWKIEL